MKSEEGEDMKEGYIKLYRSIKDNPMWTQQPFSKAQAWIDLLLLTNIKPGIIQTKNGETHKIQRGECAWSMKRLATRWKWSEGKVKRFFSYLDEENMIVQKEVPKLTIIKVLNFEKFQERRTNSSINNSINDAQTVPIEERKERKEYTTTILEYPKNQKIYGKYHNVCLSAEQYNHLLGVCASQKLLDDLVDNLSENIEEGKEKPYQCDFPNAHFIRLKKYREFRLKNPERFTNGKKSTFNNKLAIEEHTHEMVKKWYESTKENEKCK